MGDNPLDIIGQADTKNWKTIGVEFGSDVLDIFVPPHCDILKMNKMPPLAQSKQEILNALSQANPGRTAQPHM